MTARSKQVLFLLLVLAMIPSIEAEATLCPAQCELITSCYQCTGYLVLKIECNLVACLVCDHTICVGFSEAPEILDGEKLVSADPPKDALCSGAPSDPPRIAVLEEVWLPSRS